MKKLGLNRTRLVEEVPGVPENGRYYIWCGTQRKCVWHGPTRTAGEEWARDNGVVIEEFEPFEP